MTGRDYNNTHAFVSLQVVNDDFGPTAVVVPAAVQHVQMPSDFVQVESDGRLNPATIVELLTEKN